MTWGTVYRDLAGGGGFFYAVMLDGERVHETKDARDRDLFIAELKARINRIGEDEKDPGPTTQDYSVTGGYISLLNEMAEDLGHIEEYVAKDVETSNLKETIRCLRDSRDNLSETVSRRDDEISSLKEHMEVKDDIISRMKGDLPYATGGVVVGPGFRRWSEWRLPSSRRTE